MLKSGRSKAGLFALALGLLLGLACGCVAALVFIMGDDGETQVVEMTAVPLDTVEVLPTPLPDVPTPQEGKANTALYQHPTGAFHILPFGSTTDEGDNYVTFYGNENIVDVTVFNFQGQLDEGSLIDLANQILDTILVQTGWAQGFRLLDDPFETIHNGYLVRFSVDGGQNGATEGALFLVQAGRSLDAVTLLTVDYAGVEAQWYQVVESFGPGAVDLAVEPGPVDTGGEGTTGSADSGFRPEVNGFGFENYGDESRVVNLTATEMRALFGDVVCANLSGGKCTLTPPAKRWMNEANNAMAGGHCEGMAVLSQLMYYEKINPGQFGGSTAHDLAFENEELQREIARWWITQSTYPGGAYKVNESPKAVVDALQKSLSLGLQASEWWVIGIYQRDGSGGHAVTPIAVEDKGGGLFDILIYDNNFPDTTRAIEVDYNANTWSYLASTNPNEPEALYEGDETTQTLEIVALSPRLGLQECAFCGGGSGGGGRGFRNLETQQYYEIYLEGKADLLITDDQDRRLGYVDGKLVNEIPGATTDTYRFGKDTWAEDYEPLYRLPVGTTFGIAVFSGAEHTEPITAAVTMIGPGFFMAIEEIWLEPGEVDGIGIANEGNFYGMVYLTDYSETPEIWMGIETEQADYAFLVKATELVGAEDTLNVGIDLDTGEFVLNSSENAEAGTYEFYMLRIDDDEGVAFGTQDFVMQPYTTIYLQYANWAGSGQAIQAEVDLNDDGVVDEVIELPNTTDEFIWE